MFLPVSSIPEEYLYQLLPQGVIDLDKRKLIEAVLGGYQDRVSDLRSYVNALSELATPDAQFPQLSFNVVLVRFTGPTGQVITRSLDILPSTPSLDDVDGLTAWAIDQTGLDATQILSVVAGTDLLRTVDIDSVSLLAENVGALLYDGLTDTTPEQARLTRQRLLESWFPRLRIKGTAESFEVLGRIIGFEDIAVTPLWSRLVPHQPSDPGSKDNDGDFSSRPEQTPAASLPDSRYDPLDVSDGIFYDWSSGPLSEDPASARYWPLAINNRNPFIEIAVVGAVTRPLVGRYILAGGAPNTTASVFLDQGTVSSNLVANAVMDGDTFNGMRVAVVDQGGTAVGLEISDRMSAVKYRSSYFNFKATLTSAGTEPVQPSPDLEKIPWLTPDGTTQAPFRPWTGGSFETDVTLFPDAVSTAGIMIEARVQAAGTAVQLNSADFESASRLAENLDSLRAATRRIRAKGVGVAFKDQSTFAAYPDEVLLFSTTGSGTYEGTVVSGAPTPPFELFLQAYVGTTPRQTFMDSTVSGTVSAAGDGFYGFYSVQDNYYRMVVTPGDFGSSGKLIASYIADVGTNVRTEPSYSAKQNGTVGFLSRPEDQFDSSRANLSLHDENPWSRPQTFSGESVERDLYLPRVEDMALTPAEPPYKALALSGRQYEISVLDGTQHSHPYRYKVLQTQEFDPITGEAIRTNYDRLLLALDQTGALHHTLLIDDVLVASQYWSPSKWSSLAQWTPFNDHPLDSISPYSRYAQLVDSDIKHDNRLWDPVRGWYTKFDAKDGCTIQADLALGPSYSMAFWINAPTSPTTGLITKIITLSDTILVKLNQVTGGDSVANIDVSFVVNGIETPIGSQTIPLDNWTFVAIRAEGDSVDIGFGDGFSDISWSNFIPTGLVSLANQTIRVETANRSFGIHDLTLWADSKSRDDFAIIYKPAFAASPVPYPTPYVESLSRDSRYVMRLMPSGFAYPDSNEVVQVPYTPGYAQRYGFDAMFHGDDRFKQVGLGDGNEVQTVYQLGLRGIYVEGSGRTLVSGSNPSLPGYNEQWAPTPGTVDTVVAPYGPSGGTAGTVSLPSTPWPNLILTNPAQDRIFVKGDDGSVYHVYLDDLGSGVGLYAQRVNLNRPSLEFGTVPAIREEPTDAHTVIGTPGKRLSVQVTGTVFTPYEASDVGQTRTTPSVYLYRQTLVTVNALDEATAYARWADQNSFGQAEGVAALQSNGALSFANSEPLQTGIYQLSVDAGNVGAVDDEFAGFSTTISVVGSGGSVISEISAILLPNGSGSNPRGVTQLNFKLDTPIATSWVLRFDWNNDRDVPRKGQKRQLAIFGYELRLIAPALFEVSTNPLTLTSVNIGDTVNVQPGGLYAEINSYGTISALRNEATIIPDGADWPLSNLLTTSTWMRRENLRVINPSLEPDPSDPTPVTISSISLVPNSMYNIGDTVLIIATVTGPVTAFVWRFWDGTVETTDVPQISKTVTPGDGTPYAVGHFRLEVHDNLGNFAASEADVDVNMPPVLAVSADQTSGIFPYVSNLETTVSDPEFNPVTVSWFESGTHVNDGLSISFIATKSTIVTAVATDSNGGVTSKNIAFEGNPHQNPVASPIIRPDTGIISLTNDVNFAVYALDPNRGDDLVFSWSHWNGTSTGTTTRVSNSNMRFNQITVPMAGQTPGTRTVTVTVTDPDGYSTTTQTTIDLVASVPPVISSVTTPSPGALAGSPVFFAAVAVSENNDPPGYSWNFTSPRVVTLYGGNVEFDTLLADAGQIIQGTLVVDDGNGGSVSADIPPVFIATQSIAPLVVSSVPGFYQTGFTQEITSTESGATIRYSLDGTDIFKITDGKDYVGAFVFLPPTGGTGTVTMKARAFKVGFAPSDQFTGAYVFYDPNAAAATTPSVGGTSTTVTLVTVQSSADSLVSTTSIPGDNQNVDANPSSQIAGMSLTALQAEPQLKFTPLPYGVAATSVTSEKSFVTLTGPI